LTAIDPARRAQASEHVAARFSRVMNACTSPRGYLCDLSLAALFSALPLVLIVRQAAGDDLRSSTTLLLLAIGLLPILISLAISFSLRQAREGVIDWMATLPFPVENMNSLLAGISDEFEVHFQATDCPLTREELQKLLDPINDDTLATEVDGEQPVASIKIGVIDSRYLPLRTNHQRYERFRRIVGETLVPLHQKHPLRCVRVL
jgi:hypothetical protein